MKGFAVWIPIALLVISGCSGPPLGQAAQTAAAAASIDAAAPIGIGGVFHLTGPASYWGSGEADAVVMAVDEAKENGGIDSLQIELITEDGKTDFVQTSASLKKLIEVDRVPVIIGPTWFGQVAAPIAEESKVAVLSPSTGVTVARQRFFFNLWPSEKQEIVPLVGYLLSKNISKIALVYSQNEWSESMKGVFIEEAGANLIDVVRSFATAPDESDFRSVILAIKGLEVDAVYAPFAFYPSQGAFSKQAVELNLSIPVYSSSGTENPDLLKSFPQIEGTIYPYPRRGTGEEDFTDRFELRYGRRPSPSAAYAYDAMNLVIAALRDGARDPEGFARFFSSVKGYPGVSNSITFDPATGRVLEKEHTIKRVTNGRFVDLLG